MKTFVARVCLLVILCSANHVWTYGQVGSTAPLAGSVSDPSGAVVPGASVAVKNNATSAQFETITVENGTFFVPALTPGTYTVTVSLPGFKQAVVPDVKIDAGTPATVRVTLQVGQTSETVTVEAGGEILQTQTATVSTTIDIRQVVELPVSRDGLALTTILPGISSTSDYRSSRVNGLPRSAVNVTIDGVNSQPYGKDGDFFSFISPRTDAIEEVTVSTAAVGAEASANGAVQVKMVTRQGSNEFHGSLYEYAQNTALNANSWFSNRDLAPDPKTGKAPRNRVILNQFGFRLGGPIVRQRAFFFFNYEEIQQPSQVTRNRTILNPQTEQGVFQYAAGGSVQQVNLLDLASRNGQVATIDPTTGKLLSDIRNSTQGTGSVFQLTDPNLQRFTFQNKVSSMRRYPTARIDVNLTPKHHLEGSGWYQRYNTFPDTLNNIDPTFPGFPNVGGQSSDRFTYSFALRSTLTSNLVNEARFGIKSGTSRFRPEVSKAQFTGTQIADQLGFALNLRSATTSISNADISLTNPTASTTATRRNNPDSTFSDTLNWQKGAHSFSLGGSLNQANTFTTGATAVPTITFGVDTNDPANGMFSAGNFQGASTADINRAKAMYAVLTGRVAQISASAIADEKTGDFVYLGDDTERARQRDVAFFATDSWRVTSSLTVNYGLRWDIQRPYTVLNNRYTQTTLEGLYGISGVGNLFRPGVMTGKLTEFIPLKSGESVYKTEWANVAPSIGIAWSPKSGNRLLTAVLGEKSVIRAGYSIAYIRRDNSLFHDLYDGNPGGQITLTRNMNNGNLLAGSEGLPLLLRERQRLGAPSFNSKRTFPITNYAQADEANFFDPDFRVPYVQSWTLGIQRELNSSTAVEIRYVGNVKLQDAEQINLNEVNLLESGFMDEFKLAMANLQANNAAGRGATFRYAGPGTGTSPLPILLGYLAGSKNINDAASYPAAAFSNTTLINRLAANNPVPYTMAQDLYNDASRRANALTAGLPRNLFQVNPDMGAINLMRNGGYTNYNALAIELRRRMSKGLLVSGSYVFSKTQASDYDYLRTGRPNTLTTTHIPNVFKSNWIYELPLGQGRWLFGNARSLLNKVIGGWQLGGTARIQSGDPNDLATGSGNTGQQDVRLVGMTLKELQKSIKIRYDDANRVVYSLPQDIIDNTVRAFNVSATSANGYSSLGAPSGRYISPANRPGCIQLYEGECGGNSIVVIGPRLIQFDLAASKRTRITEKIEFEFRAEAFNAFNTTNFSAPNFLGTYSAQTYGQVSTADAARTVQLIGRINF